MMYEPGERVRVRYGFSKRRFKDDPNVDPKMLIYEGQEHEISRVASICPAWYRLYDCPFIWDERWLEPVEDKIQTMNENDIMSLLGE